jgi:hypothetical protein
VQHDDEEPPPSPAGVGVQRSEICHHFWRSATTIFFLSSHITSCVYVYTYLYTTRVRFSEQHQAKQRHRESDKKDMP